MKSLSGGSTLDGPASHPARGAWIEMFARPPIKRRVNALSHPARGAWIEIITELSRLVPMAVAPRKGCVD